MSQSKLAAWGKTLGSVVLMILVGLLILGKIGSKLSKHDKAVRQESIGGNPSDLSHLLVGSWARTSMDADGDEFSGIDSYYSDGTSTFSGTIKFKEDGKSLAVSCSSRWEIEGKKLRDTITQTSHPQFLPVGKVITDEIISIDSDKLVTRDAEGEVETAHRIKK